MRQRRWKRQLDTIKWQLWDTLNRENADMRLILIRDFQGLHYYGDIPETNNARKAIELDTGIVFDL